MHPYGLSGGPVAKQPLLWQDRRDRNAPEKTEDQKWWLKFKKKSESQLVPPNRVFSMDKGVLGGRMVMNLATGPANTKPHSNQPRLFHKESQDEGPTRPQLNLRDIESQFRPLDEFVKPTKSETFMLHTPDATSSGEESAPLQKTVETAHNLLSNLQYLNHMKRRDLKTSSETDIIRPPSPFMDSKRRRPPPVPKEGLSEPAPVQDEVRPRRKLTSTSRPISLSEHSKTHSVKDAISLFERKTPNYATAATGELLSIKIPNKAKNVRQRSRGPSRTPSDLDLSIRQHASPQDISPGEGANRMFFGEKRLSESYDFCNTDAIEHAHSRDRSFSDAASLDSTLDSLEPQVKEKKASLFRGFINATRGKIGMDSEISQERSNTEPFRRKAKRSSSSVKPVKSEITMGELGDLAYAERTSSFGIKRKKSRKPRHLELKEGFNVKGFDNFMLY